MNENFNSKEFNKFIKAKIVTMIEESFSLQDNENNFKEKINETRSFLFSIINDQYISNTNKISFYFFFLESINNYAKEWIVEFLTQIVLKLKQKEISDEDFIKSEYFLFKFLSNKEKIKTLRTIYYDLFNVSLFMARKIYFFVESKSIFKEDNKVIDFIKEKDRKINEVLNINNNNNISNENKHSLLLKYPEKLQNILNLYEDKFIDIINNKYFFEKKDDNIFITEPFKYFFAIIIGLNVENISFVISDDYVFIKNQFNEILSNFQPFA